MYIIASAIRRAIAPGLAPRDRRVRGRPLDRHSVVVDLDEKGCPDLAMLVGAVEEWRASARAGEAVLELEGETAFAAPRRESPNREGFYWDGR